MYRDVTATSQTIYQPLFNFSYGPHAITHHTTKDATLYEKNAAVPKLFAAKGHTNCFKIALTCTVLHQRLRSYFDPITDVEIRI